MDKLRRVCARALVLTFALLPAALSAQAAGVITGRVTGQGTGQAIAGAQLRVQGTALRTVTDAQGQYRIAGVPAGTYTVTAALIGREPSNREVTVAAGQTQVLNFALASGTIALEGLVVTATGEEQRARELGNAVGQINVAEEVPLAAVNDVAGVLTGRVAGVSVLQAGGTTGTGARIRIRGSNSVSLSNDPLLIIDGVRADNNSTSSIGVGGQTTNRLNDMNPEDIENIEVLKGPAASSLYGTAAANGVIVVTTKKGRAGRTRYSAYTEQGTLEDVTTYPGNFFGATATGGRCLLANVARGRCEQAEIRSFNPLEDPRSTPFEQGRRQKYGVSASGGTDQATYFLSGDFEDEQGIYKFDASSLERKSLRANIRGQLHDNLDVTVNTGYINSDLRLPQNDNNILGIVSGALLSTVTEFDEESLGFGFGLTPEDIAQIDTRQNVERITGSTTANFRPLTWLSIVGTVGLDRVNRFDNETIPPERVFFGALSEGERTSNRIQVSNYTANLGATGSFNFRENITATSSIGTQYNEEIFRGTYAFGAKLLAGTGALGGTTSRFAVDEANSQVRTIGGYVQQQFGINDRLFLTGAIRADDNSAFGNDFGLAYYPAASVSWVVAEEPWFPQFNALSLFRLRAAYGRSGLRPGQLDAVRFFNPTPVTLRGVSVPGFTFGGAGNVNLRPETSSEIEVGFDAGLLDDRVGFELTYYNKTSENALISRRLPPSLGVSATRFDNLGEVQNKGLEGLLSLRLIDRPRFQWEATVTGARTENELTDIGIDPSTGEPIPPIIFGLGGDSQRHQEGFPLGSYFGTKYTFEDADNNGLIDPSELTFEEEQSFLGSPFPTREASFSSSATLGGIVRVSGLLDYRGGYKNFNSTEEFRCGAFLTCQDLYDPNTSLEEQAAAVATAFYNVNSGYVEDASFVKLREISVALMAPKSFANRFGSEGLSLTLAGRNLATWTDYRGLDPEINFAGSGSNFSTAEFLSQPPVRFFTARLELTF